MAEWLQNVYCCMYIRNEHPFILISGRYALHSMHFFDQLRFQFFLRLSLINLFCIQLMVWSCQIISSTHGSFHYWCRRSCIWTMKAIIKPVYFLYPCSTARTVEVTTFLPPTFKLTSWAITMKDAHYTVIGIPDLVFVDTTISCRHSKFVSMYASYSTSLPPDLITMQGLWTFYFSLDIFFGACRFLLIIGLVHSWIIYAWYHE